MRAWALAQIPRSTYVMLLHTWRGGRADTRSQRGAASGSNLPEKTGIIDARDNCSGVTR